MRLRPLAVLHGRRGLAPCAVWGGKIIHPKRFHDRLASDLTQVLQKVADGTTHIAARLPLTDASQALRLAESGTTSGKIVRTL